MKIMSFAGIVLRDAGQPRVLLLKRSMEKTLHPGLYSGLGGKFEPGETARECIMREGAEEAPQIDWSEVTGVRQHLRVAKQLPDMVHDMHWFTGVLHRPLEDFSSTEGTLHWVWESDMPQPVDTMTPAAYAAVSFMLGLAPDDQTLYEATLSEAHGLPVLDFGTN